MIDEIPQNIQQAEAEEERKLSLRRMLVLGFIIFAAVFYFVWSNFLNFGTLRVIGQAPFSVNVIDEKQQECDASPCDIKLKRGAKFVSISKEGFDADAIEAEVILWDTAVIKPVFKLEPYIREVTEMPKAAVSTTQTKYNFFYDSAHNNYAIAKDESLPISYFGGKLQKPFLIGSDNAVLAFENVANGKAFYIDAVTQSRIEMKKPFTLGVRAKPSPNGRYFLIENEAKTLFIANSKAISQIRIAATFENAFWTLQNSLVLAYTTPEKFIFAKYDPDTDESQTLFTSDSMLGTSLPKNIMIDPATNTVFFESNAKKYEIIF